MNQISFTNINHVVRKSLGLTMNEYAVAELIYHLSNNPDGDIQGWCYASRSSMGEMLDLSKISILSIIEKLIQGGFVEKHSQTKHLKTTNKWYQAVVIKIGKETIPTVKKDTDIGKETIPVIGKESLPNKDIYNKDNNKDHNLANKFAGKGINDLLLLFKGINPNYEKLYANKTERKALQELVDKYTYQKIENMLVQLPQIISKPYAPRISTPLVLQRKLGDLLIFIKQENGREVKNGKWKGIDATSI